eukprot:gnl/TRDRNA2_/TRDRNA2_194643_c0_seq1.p1 gnl/TRDRNA2_/TRDRNA2_194643_c0~~gnl/TRDRNA2_/TRDRNA2_194643_c0_seq1.p1  ORF type:complete len:251 (-),score=52.21 gnl/TRDRNA2_/TRDRNA2_194643_c0_seq1:120-872(-)
MAWGADAPFLTRLAIRRWKARFPFWPPKDASPVTPIEPWGKQFFVYNARPSVEFRGDPRAPPLDDIRPKWLRDEDAASLLHDGEDVSAALDGRSSPLGREHGIASLSGAKPQAAGTETTTTARLAAGRAGKLGAGSSETVVCATDFRQRPLLYLHPDEWAGFLEQIPRLREELRRCQQRIDELDERGASDRDYRLRRKLVPDKYDTKMLGVAAGGGRGVTVGKVGPKTRERRVRSAATELAEANKFPSER